LFFSGGPRVRPGGAPQSCPAPFLGPPPLLTRGGPPFFFGGPPAPRVGLEKMVWGEGREPAGRTKFKNLAPGGPIFGGGPGKGLNSKNRFRGGRGAAVESWARAGKGLRGGQGPRPFFWFIFICSHLGRLGVLFFKSLGGWVRGIGVPGPPGGSGFWDRALLSKFRGRKKGGRGGEKGGGPFFFPRPGGGEAPIWGGGPKRGGPNKFFPGVLISKKSRATKRAKLQKNRARGRGEFFFFFFSQQKRKGQGSRQAGGARKFVKIRGFRWILAEKRGGKRKGPPFWGKVFKSGFFFHFRGGFFSFSVDFSPHRRPPKTKTKNFPGVF